LELYGQSSVSNRGLSGGWNTVTAGPLPLHEPTCGII